MLKSLNAIITSLIVFSLSPLAQASKSCQDITSPLRMVLDSSNQQDVFDNPQNYLGMTISPSEDQEIAGPFQVVARKQKGSTFKDVAKNALLLSQFPYLRAEIFGGLKFNHPYVLPAQKHDMSLAPPAISDHKTPVMVGAIIFHLKNGEDYVVYYTSNDGFDLTSPDDLYVDQLNLLSEQGLEVSGINTVITKSESLYPTFIDQSRLKYQMAQVQVNYPDLDIRRWLFTTVTMGNPYSLEVRLTEWMPEAPE